MSQMASAGEGEVGHRITGRRTLGTDHGEPRGQGETAEHRRPAGREHLGDVPGPPGDREESVAIARERGETDLLSGRTLHGQPMHRLALVTGKWRQAGGHGPQ